MIQAGPRNGVGLGALGYVSDYTLITSTTNITSPIASPISGETLTVFVTQDATGGRQITWSTAFKLAPVLPDNLLPLSVAVFRFVARSDGKWWLVGDPMVEMIP
jgi:hypothetical protein